MVEGLPDGVQVTNATGRTAGNVPYVQLRPADGLLASRAEGSAVAPRVRSVSFASADIRAWLPSPVGVTLQYRNRPPRLST